MSRILAGGVSILLLAGTVALAQTTHPAVQAGQYTGVLTGTNVYVRSSPVDGYPCTKLSAPARVLVVGEQDGWLKIAPPRGCYSLVAKRYVRAVGSAGTITGDSVNVRAGSSLMPGWMDRIQTRLNTGDRVVIVGQTADGFYKIVPPPGVVLWVSGRYVRRVGPATTLPAATRPVAVRPATMRVIVPASQIAAVGEEGKLWDAAEKALNDELAKPREQRDMAGLLAKYQAIRPSADSPLAAYVQARTKFIQGEIELADDLRAVAKLVADVKAVETTLAADKGRIEVKLPPTTRRTYAAEGVLAPSGLFPGGATGPKRYIVKDPAERIIHAYVQCTTGVVDLSKHVGAYVGVVGTARFDENLRMYLVEAEQIIVLQAPPEPGPGPKPEPRITPAPEPEPTITPAPEPTITPAPEPMITPAPEPTTKPVPEPIVKPAPEPTTKPAPKFPAGVNVEPLPETGLPVVGTSGQPKSDNGVNRKEYE